MYLNIRSNEMIMKNPLSDEYSEEEHLKLVDQVLEGNSKALDKLVAIHQAFIYNVAWKMTHSNEYALDLTQEVLIKVVTKLSTFKRKSAFRTWLYRIVFNEFLQTKRKTKEEALWKKNEEVILNLLNGFMVEQD